MTPNRNALVIGAGPAGASAAILLARAGWQVSLVEQHEYPRQKVCGECIAAGNLPLLDELGVGQAFRQLAGPLLTHVGWMRGATTVVAKMPTCAQPTARYGRALGRDVFDALLLERARILGVRILQPARVRNVRGLPGDFSCYIEHLGSSSRGSASARRAEIITAAIVIDAHGSWASGADFNALGEAEKRVPQHSSDLFAFKASFYRSRSTPGLLPVVAIAGGYGGMVVADQGRLTVALCVRRDVLRALRAKNSGVSAGLAVEFHLRKVCRGVQEVLQEAHRVGSWLSVGPLRPGVRLQELPGVFRVGNAAGESHPLIGEGITMALQSSKLLVESLSTHANRTTGVHELSISQHSYAKAWRACFQPRLRLAALYAHVAMCTPMAAPVEQVLKQWPALLTTSARFAGKARPAAVYPKLCEKVI